MNDIAFQFLDLDDNLKHLIKYGLAVLFSILAVLTTKRTQKLTRGPYFAFSCIIFLAIVAVRSFHYAALDIWGLNALWIFVAAELIAYMVAGYFIYRFAMGRSFDLFGHTKGAPLALIPLANLWLFLSPSEETARARRRVLSRTSSLEEAIAKSSTPEPDDAADDKGQDSLLSLKRSTYQDNHPLAGGLGFGVGVIALFIALSVGSIQRYVVAPLFSPKHRAEMAERAEMKEWIETEGLENVVAEMARHDDLPRVLDETTTLIAMQANGRQLSYIYAMSLDTYEIPNDDRTGTRDFFYRDTRFGPLLRAGGSIGSYYIDQKGQLLDAMIASKEDCLR